MTYREEEYLRNFYHLFFIFHRDMSYCVNGHSMRVLPSGLRRHLIKYHPNVFKIFEEFKTELRSAIK